MTVSFLDSRTGNRIFPDAPPPPQSNTHPEKEEQRFTSAYVVDDSDPFTEEEVFLLYDNRTEQQALHDTYEAIAQASGSGVVPFRRSIDTLYKKKAVNRDGSLFERQSGMEEEKLVSLIPRHIEWAVRNVSESPHRGLEEMYNGQVIDEHRKGIIHTILAAQRKGELHDEKLAAMANRLTQQSTYVAWLIGKGDQEVSGLFASYQPKELIKAFPRESRLVRSPAA